MEIRDEHVEWAVLERLGLMLQQTSSGDEKYGTTHAFALFSAITGWVRQRVGYYTGYEEWPNELQMLGKSIFEDPWSLDQKMFLGEAEVTLFRSAKKKKIDLSCCNMWELLVWVRNAMAHGDHRSVFPEHEEVAHGKPERHLIGFRFVKGQCSATLTAFDMQRVGQALVEIFCRAYGQNECWKKDARDGVIERAAA